MSEWRGGVRYWLAVGFLLAAALLSGCVSRKSLQDRGVRAEEAARVYDRATQLVGRKFYDATFGGRDWVALAREGRSAALSAADEPGLYRAINETLGKLEVSHLVALTPRETAEADRGSRARIGLSWFKYPEGWIVEGVVPGGPADLAGVKVGWVLVSVNGRPAEEAVRVRPAVGEVVRIVCSDENGALHDFALTARELETLAPATERVLPGGVVLLRFDEFGPGSRRWLSGALKRHRQAPGVIVDLRRNHGGAIYALDFVAGELFPESRPMGKTIQRDGDETPARGFQWFSARYAGPLVVLIDNSTFSAGEILAHMLQYHQRATLVGRKTGGAVIVARYYRLPGGGRLVIPVYDYVGLDGQRLEGRGVQPDISVERDLKALREGRDVDVEAALRVLGNKEVKERRK